MDQLNQVSPIHLIKKLDDCIQEEESMNEEKCINLTISEEIESQLSNVREHLNIPDNLTAARWAISLYSKLIDAEKAGREVRIHNKDGKQYSLEFSTGS